MALREIQLDEGGGTYDPNTRDVAIGEGCSWDPPGVALAPAGHPWNRPGFKPRQAL